MAASSCVQMRRHEVGDPDAAYLAVGVELLQGLVGGDGQVEFTGQCLVQDQQVDAVDAELSRGFVESVQCRVVAEIGDPDLRLDEHLVAGQPGTTDRFADPALVAVGGCGVDVPVTGAQRRFDRGGGLVGRCLIDPESDDR